MIRTTYMREYMRRLRAEWPALDSCYYWLNRSRILARRHERRDMVNARRRELRRAGA